MSARYGRSTRQRKIARRSVPPGIGGVDARRSPVRGRSRPRIRSAPIVQVAFAHRSGQDRPEIAESQVLRPKFTLALATVAVSAALSACVEGDRASITIDYKVT